MRILRLIFVLMLLCFALLAGCDRAREDQLAPPADPPSPTDPQDPLVARIGGQPVDLAQWQQARAYALATLRLLGEPGAALDEGAALISYLEDVLISQAALNEGYFIDAAAVTLEQERMLQVAGKSEADLREIWAQVGLSEPAWTAELSRAVQAASYLQEVVAADLPPGQRAQARQNWLENEKENRGFEVFLATEPVVGLQTGNLAPEFQLMSLEGEMITLSQFRGRPVILNFWATWCVPCQDEMPMLQSIYEQYSPEGLVVLGVDVGENREQVSRFTEGLGVTFPIVLDQQQAVTRRYRIFGLPTTFFINEQGVIDYVIPGALTREALDIGISSFFQDASAE